MLPAKYPYLVLDVVLPWAARQPEGRWRRATRVLRSPGRERILLFLVHSYKKI